MVREDSEISAVPLDAVDRWIAALGAVPPAARVYDVAPRRAELEFGITSAIANLLADRGLPRSSFEGEARFAWSDLHYIALRLGSARVYLRTMRSWANSVTKAAQSGSHMIELRYRTYASPGATVDVLLPEGRRVKTVIGPDQIVARLNVHMANCESAFPPSVQRVLHQAAAFDFYMLPPTLAGDVDFARRTGLAACFTASRFVVSECQQRGIEARMAYGLLLAPPLGTPHEWAEIRLGGIWAPADPLLLSILGRFAGLDASRWPPTHSPNAVLLRLAASRTPIVEGAGRSVETSFVVSVGEQASRPVAAAFTRSHREG
ncbi:MAG: transglutaminase domain-containing protein [Solirubrobacteraceae bacterium]